MWSISKICVGVQDIFHLLETAEASIFVSLNELKKYNVMIADKRTSVTLEPKVWSILNEVADDQGASIHELCSFIAERKSADSSLSSAIRVFLISYLHIKVSKG